VQIPDGPATVSAEPLQFTTGSQDLGRWSRQRNTSQ